MELLISINLDNAALNDEVDDQHVLVARGVAFGLTRVIDSINGLTWTDTQEQITDQPLYAGRISDENGNVVGRWAIAAEPEDEALKARPSRHG